MTDSQVLEEATRRYVSEMGKWFPGERVIFRGQDLHRELADLDWFGLFLYAITGRRFSPGQMRVLNAIWTGTSYPDPRLWNNRVVALAASARSTSTLALGAATAVSEATIYGHQANAHAIDFILRAHRAVDHGGLIAAVVEEELRTRRRVGGYGRPVHRSDERIPHLRAILAEEGLLDGPHVQLAFAIEQVLQTGRWRFHMNISGLDAAIAADFGFSPDEYLLYASFVFSAGMMPIYLENKRRAPGTFFPLRCEVLAYEGAPARSWGASAPASPDSPARS